MLSSENPSSFKGIIKHHIEKEAFPIIDSWSLFLLFSFIGINQKKKEHEIFIHIVADLLIYFKTLNEINCLSWKQKQLYSQCANLTILTEPLLLKTSLASTHQILNSVYLLFITAFCHAFVILLYSFKQPNFAIRDSLRVSNLVLNELLTPSKYIKIIE